MKIDKRLSRLLFLSITSISSYAMAQTEQPVVRIEALPEAAFSSTWTKLQDVERLDNICTTLQQQARSLGGQAVIVVADTYGNPYRMERPYGVPASAADQVSALAKLSAVTGRPSESIDSETARFILRDKMFANPNLSWALRKGGVPLANGFGGIGVCFYDENNIPLEEESAKLAFIAQKMMMAND